MKAKTFDDAVNDFILQRINTYELSDDKAVTEAEEKLHRSLGNLDAEKSILNSIENGCILFAGELKNAYYRAGFSDAINFIFGWRDRIWK